MRHFVRLAYKGTPFSGWQRQPHAPSVQQLLEEKFSLILRESVEVVGCGRTDAGVHAGMYYLHFDLPGPLPERFVSRVNQLLPDEVALQAVARMPDEAHARFDATSRTYHYFLCLVKDPFRKDLAYYFPYPERPDLAAMQQAAALLLRYDAFFPFCRSKSDARTMRCDLRTARWEKKSDGTLQFIITADRFLRGMVRLIVGMCLNVGLGKTSLQEVRWALDKQERLPQPVSAPPEGLYLAEVTYPFPVP